MVWGSWCRVRAIALRTNMWMHGGWNFEFEVLRFGSFGSFRAINVAATRKSKVTNRPGPGQGVKVEYPTIVIVKASIMALVVHCLRFSEFNQKLENISKCRAIFFGGPYQPDIGRSHRPVCPASVRTRLSFTETAR